MSPWVDLGLRRSRTAAGDLVVRFGVPVLDTYLEFLSVRSRPNTVTAVAYDLKVFFMVVGKSPARVVAADVLGFVTAQHTGQPAGRLRGVVDSTAGLSARTVRRRLSSVSGLYAFLQTRGDVSNNPVPRGLPTRRERQRPRQGVPLIRTPRTLPRILAPAQVDDVQVAARRVFIAEGKGGHQRVTRSPAGSSPHWRPTCISSGRPTRPPTGCSWC
jgi:site-specific recombinase XerC